ncbi:hypothetical protein BDEG_24884 [Batrachochytrium dendrobatidis JEL423]|uniref:Enhancer of translation termination 1 n=1 Tax=Batrachochytrium dendrobatidis (strain JEL423) TaxID=403673 RepID=A0A177WN24_BATDL|nr:hypothetical protein BDEG_24884 [Batrachochytrium dendrobatidis JEL423]
MTNNQPSQKRPMGLRKTKHNGSDNSTDFDLVSKRAKLDSTLTDCTTQSLTDTNSKATQPKQLDTDHGMDQNTISTDEIQDTIIFEVASESDEVEDVEQMLIRGHTDIEAGQVQEGILLLRGCIHECDKMIRVRNGNIPKATKEEQQLQQVAIAETPTLSAMFYWVYGCALYYLGLAEAQSQTLAESGSEESNPTKLADFIEAAIDRLETGLELGENDPVAICKINGFLGKIKMHKISLVFETPKVVEQLLNECQVHFSIVLDSKLEDKVTWISMMSDIAQICYNYSEKDDIKLEDKKQLTEFSQKIWKIILKEDDRDVNSLVGLGSALLATADELIEAAEQNESEDQLEDALSLLLQAAHYFRSALDLTQDQDKVNVPVLCLLGETCIHLGNLNEDDDEQSINSQTAVSFYIEAVQSFNKVQQSDPEALPAQFAEFLQEWDADMH